MPTDEDQYQKDKNEFADSVDAILAADPEMSDEDLNKKLDKELGKEGTDEAGDATGDQSTIKPDDPIEATDDDPIKADDQNGQDKNSATKVDQSTTVKGDDDAGIDWKARCQEAEGLLAKEQHKTKSWNGRITASNTQVKKLEEEVARLKVDTGEEPTTEAEHMAKFKNDFPELHSMFEMQQKQIEALKPKDADVDVDSDLDAGTAAAAPIPAKTTDVDNKAHFDTIIKVHPDKDEIVNTGVLKTWINQQSDLLRPTLDRIYSNGDANEVIKLITDFKEKSGWKSAIHKDGEDKEKQDKLDAMKEVTSEGGGPVDKTGPDKNDFAQGAKDAGL